MKSEEIVRRVLDGLDAVKIPYVLVGSFASNAYGVSRSTQDADIVVQMLPGQLNELIKYIGPEFELEPQMQFETVTGTRKTLLRERESGFAIELFELSSDPHDQQRFARRRQLTVLDRETWILTVEDVLVTKLNWLRLANRTKDMLDIRSVIAVQDDAIDWPYVERWCDEHGSRPLLEKIRDELRKR
jgi:hypothetical protein